MKLTNTPVQRDENIHIGRLFLSLWKYKLYYLIAICVAIILTALTLSFVPKEFFIEGRLQLISSNSGMGSELKAIKSSGVGGMFGGGSSGGSSDDEAAIILSRRILTQTIIKKELQVNIEKKEGLKTVSCYGDKAPYKFNFTPNFLETFPDVISLNIQQRKQGTEVTISSKTIEEKTIAEKRFPITLSTQWGKIYIEKGLTWTDESTVEVVLDPLQLAFEKYQNSLVVRPIDVGSDILQLIIPDNDKQRGIALVNGLMQNYIEYTKYVKLQESDINQKFVEDKLQQVSAELNHLEKEIELYKRQNKIPEIQAYGSITYTGSETTNKRLLEMQTDLTMLSSAIDYLKDPKNEYAIAPSIEYGSEAIGTYNQLMFRRLELLKSSEPSNIAIQLLNDQLREQRKVLISTLQAGRRNMEYLISEIRKENKSYEARLNELPAQEKKYIEMVRLQRTQEALYVFLLQKKQEKEIANAPDEQAGRILDYAYCSYKHIFPKGSVMLPLFLALCLVIAIFIAATKEFILRKTIKETDIPDLLDITPWGTFHDEESVKRLRRLIYDQNHKGGVFLVTSSIPNEGKTFFTTQIVKALNETGHKATSLVIEDSTSSHSINDEIRKLASDETTYVFIEVPSLAESSISYDLVSYVDYTFFLCRIGVTSKTNLHELNQEIHRQTLGKVAVVLNKKQ